MYSAHKDQSYDAVKFAVPEPWRQFSTISPQDDDFDYDYDFSRPFYTGLLDYYDASNTVVSIKEEPDPIEQEAYCLDTVLFSEKFVDYILKEAIKRLRQMHDPDTHDYGYRKSFFDSKPRDSKFHGSFYSDIASDLKFPVKPLPMKWPKISEFNIKFGHEKLEYFVSRWERSDDWMFCVDFLGFESEDCSNIFVYEVEWSKPTKSYPIPQATASVYFGLEVSKIVPYNYDQEVQVYYVFECSNTIHRPGRINFQEVWLQDIIDAKLKFFKTITFSVPKGVCDITPPENETKPKSKHNYS